MRSATLAIRKIHSPTALGILAAEKQVSKAGEALSLDHSFFTAMKLLQFFSKIVETKIR